MAKMICGAFLFCFFISKAVIAAPHYQVNMRVGMSGLSPFSINTTAKSGKKSFISQFSDDGQVETLVEVYAKQSQVNKKDGLFMEVAVSKRVRGQLKATERTQIFAPENEETETGMNSKGKMAGNLALAVMAHQL